LIDIFWGGVAVSKPLGMEVIRYSCHSHHQEDLYKDFLSIGTGFGVAIKKSKFFDIGMFDVTYRVAEDTEFFLRALCCKLKIMPIDTIAAIKNENHNERLSYGYKAYSSAHIYERIFRQYQDFLKRYPYIYASMLFWAYRVHNANHNAEGVSAVLAALFLL